MHPIVHALDRLGHVRLTTKISLSGARHLSFQTSQTNHGSIYSNDAQLVRNDFSYCVNLVKERDGEGYRKFRTIY
jgi:hypothetical protein